MTLLLISQDRLPYHIINCFLENSGLYLKDICGREGLAY